MSGKRILYVEENLDGTIGGSHYCLLELVRGIDKTRFSPAVVFFQDNVLIPEFKKLCPVITFHKQRGWVIKRDFPAFYSLAERSIALVPVLALFQKTYNFFRYALVDFFKVISLLKKYRIDLVHLNNAPDLTDWLVACKFLGKKCIAHVRGFWTPTGIQKRIAPYYDAIISISSAVTEHVRSVAPSAANVVTIHDGIDITAVLKMKGRSSDDIRKELGIATTDYLIVVAGNIKPWKGQHTVIEAMKSLKARFPHIKCLIVGDVAHTEEDKRYHNRLRKLVSNGLTQNIFFAGFKKNTPEIMSAADLLVHTSVSPEPLGRVILEGMVFGKPVIATAHGGPLDIIEDGISGFLVPPNDPAALAEKIECLVTRPDTGKKVGDMAGKRVEEKFNVDLCLNKIESLYQVTLR